MAVAIQKEKKKNLNSLLRIFEKEPISALKTALEVFVHNFLHA